VESSKISRKNAVLCQSVRRVTHGDSISISYTTTGRHKAHNHFASNILQAGVHRLSSGNVSKAAVTACQIALLATA
jgi:hypothetical protein